MITKQWVWHRRPASPLRNHFSPQTQHYRQQGGTDPGQQGRNIQTQKRIPLPDSRSDGQFSRTYPTPTEMGLLKLHFLGQPHICRDNKVFLGKERQPLRPQRLRCCLFTSTFLKLSMNSCHSCEPWGLTFPWLQDRQALLEHRSSILTS